MLIPSCGQLYYPSRHIIREPVFNEIIPGSIPLAYYIFELPWPARSVVHQARIPGQHHGPKLRDPLLRFLKRPALIVRVQYFVRGGFVDHHSRLSSKHLSSHLPVDWVRFLGGQKGVALQLQDARVGVGSNKYADRSWCSDDEAHFWLNGYVNKRNCRIWSEANPQVNVETPLHPEKLTVWCALWAGGILLQKR
ncbi:uncharacterized protein TNCV_1173622 [Trichonephila clavipes]|uniref:Uncharacterized protein n=1 Tax=Trichonephila clavipes TaxID=2585209 RepID=A0A8X6RYD8_TRICX|nr:uncharacterized protein TNCV_1173622 [Trichonephila clavipes]